MQLSSVQPVFKLELNHKVTPGIVTIAKYDGTHPCLTACAGFDKIIIHHPHGGMGSGRAQRSEAHGEVSELNLSQAVVALAAGPLKPDVNRDMLLIGSPTQILEAPDGVNFIIAGSFGKHDSLAIVGGNSSVLGLNWEGEEVFWTVASGKVCAMITLDFDKDGENELIVGCDDSYIRVLKHNQFIAELPETGPVVSLTQISDVRFAYGLANGTIGIYEEGIRLWRVKSKQNALSLQWSGETLACCWSNGRLDWRDGNSGRVLRRLQMRSNAAAMLLADYRSIGASDLVCVSDRVLGFAPYQETAAFDAAKKLPSEEDRAAITELFNRKQGLMTIVRAALVLAEGIFETGETLARHPSPSQLRSLLHVPLRPPRDVVVDVHIKNFLLEEDMELASEDTKELHIGLHCMRDESRLKMDFGSDGQVRFGTHDIRLAGDLIQSLAVYLNLTDLQ
ncbi:putative Bbs2 protein, partial [Operophtera brumata]